MVQTVLVNTHLPQFHMFDLPAGYILKRPSVGTVYLQCDFLHNVPPLAKFSRHSVAGEGHPAPNLLSMGIHPSPMWVPGAFQRDVGTSGKLEPRDHG